MAIRPIEMNAVISRTQDIGTMKHQEDSKPMIDQQHYQHNFQQEIKESMKQVRHADDSDNHEKRYDAKEKGNAEYQDNRKKKKGKVEKETEKKAGSSSRGFDVTI